MKLDRGPHQDGERWRCTVVLSDGKYRHFYFPPHCKADCEALAHGIELVTARSAASDDPVERIRRPPEDRENAAEWWRDTLLERAYEAAVRGDDGKLAQLSRSAVGFENIAKMKGLITRLMTRIEKLQAGTV